MPKPSQGVAVAETCQQLDIKDFIRAGLLKNNTKVRGKFVSRNISGVDSDPWILEIVFNDEEKYVRITSTKDSKLYYGVEEIDYKIKIVGVRSNLGKGYVYYFECPRSNRRSRILYKTYDSNYFMARTIYHRRIYYDCQTHSKRWYAYSRYAKLKHRLDRMLKGNFRESYNGKKTKSFEKVEKLKEKIEKFDKLSAIEFHKALMKM